MLRASRTFGSAVVALLVGALAAPPALAQGAEAAIELRGERLGGADLLVQSFRVMAFGDPGAARPGLRRWQKPVRAALVGDAAESHRGEVRALFGTFAALTGIPFLIVDEESQANLVVYFSAREWYTSAVAKAFPQAAGVLCFTNTRSDGAGALVLAVTVIPEDLAPRASRTCLAHELMHALGFAGHAARGFDSALRNGIGVDRLTVNDHILIRALYDERLRPNMSADQAAAVATQVIGGLLGQVHEAEDPMEVLAVRAPVSRPRKDDDV